MYYVKMWGTRVLLCKSDRLPRQIQKLRAFKNFLIFQPFQLYFFLFRISEKVSTPTSVILMAINTVTGNLKRCKT